MRKGMATVGMKGMARLGLIVALFVAGLLLAAPSAHAVSFDLTSNHCTVPADCGAPGTIFGTVAVTQNGANVDITVHLNSPYVWAKTGSADFMAFKFNGVGVAVGDITVNQTFAGQTLAAAAGTFNGDGTGTFGFGIECTTCGNGISTISSDIVFHVANATIADVTNSTLSGTGNIFVADLGNSLNGATGPIDASGPSGPPVSEPGAMLLLGSGLSGLVVCRRLRSRA